MGVPPGVFSNYRPATSVPTISRVFPSVVQKGFSLISQGMPCVSPLCTGTHVTLRVLLSFYRFIIGYSILIHIFREFPCVIVSCRIPFSVLKMLFLINKLENCELPLNDLLLLLLARHLGVIADNRIMGD